MIRSCSYHKHLSSRGGAGPCGELVVSSLLLLFLYGRRYPHVKGLMLLRSGALCIFEVVGIHLLEKKVGFNSVGFKHCALARTCAGLFELQAKRCCFVEQHSCAAGGDCDAADASETHAERDTHATCYPESSQ